ncbi:glycosyltransferase family 4 protein [Rhodovulum steppense]|uniref:Glycosyltransferase involved in cell wall biosynthesis n=1 Tax=Rhodovulum steppense TaxID=540251 RepID=A0A4R1YT89_9RHOB|nr:glycosyltransferase family 4 protein [Rhodovulum steppense]TCM82644.1 glycosyltransferase involved in cell wall biosynthesis [Rhodovulum steppense]
MRIVLVMTGGGGGGLQQSVVPYAAALTRAGHAVLAIVLGSSPFVAELGSLGVSVVTTRWPRKPRPFTWIQALVIRRAAQAFGAEIALAFASKGLAPALHALGGQMPVLSRCGATRERTVSRLLGADGLIATSDEMRALILRLGMPTERVHLLPNFLTGAARLHSRAPGDPPVVGSLGRMVPRKGFDVLLRACGVLARRGRPVRLLLGGSGRERDALEKLAKAEGVAAEFRGWISNAEKTAFFDEIDIFACPSRLEPFGFIYLEAMQAGVPVVTTDTVGARFIFSPGTDGMVVPQGDAEAMADAIAALLDDPKARAEMTAAARGTFLGRFHIDAATGILDDILREALAQGARG